jgi:DNA polymerase III subunit delta'
VTEPPVPVLDTAGDAPGPTRPSMALFDAVPGQAPAVELLRAAARHPVHAYLFVGPAGAGPRSAARAFAAALLCPDGGCGICWTCQRALAGTHPDQVEMERTGAALDVEGARRLVNLAQRRPLEAARQVLVVPDVHLALRSAPALLKTVEEPPPSTVFVLVADDIPPELVTVASRCVEVSFPPVSSAVVAGWLESRGVDAERSRLVAEGAGGDLDRAQLLAEDPAYAARLAAWRSVPGRLDGSGATAGALARELLESLDGALEPLRAQHVAELQRLEAEAKAAGERGLPGRREITDRQRREERRWRTDELRAGLGVLARTYRDRLVDLVDQLADTRRPRAVEARSEERAVALVGEAAAALVRNPQETLLLEALFVRLGKL